jgi:hypothetical protein
MAGNLSPAAQGRLAELTSLHDKLHRVHGLVEHFATAKAKPEQYLLPITRNFSQLKMHFMGAGLDAMSQLAAAMEIAARRGTSPVAKARILREGVGSLRFQLEMAQRAVVSEDQVAQQKAEEKVERQKALD